jgi:uncharacterized protein YmfQ (DUF2313 family)
MADSLYAVGDYVAALQRLLPRGRAWPRDPTANLTALVAGLAPTFARLDARAQGLLADAFPVQPVELLPEWEATLGLPDPCAGPAPTLQQRQAQAKARFTNLGGQSIDFLKSYAADLGFAITITEYTVFRAGGSRAADPCNGAAWAYAFQVSTLLKTETAFVAGDSAAGEPLATWDDAVLECELARVAPAHAPIVFAYTADLTTESGLALTTEAGGFVTVES